MHWSHLNESNSRCLWCQDFCGTFFSKIIIFNLEREEEIRKLIWIFVLHAKSLDFVTMCEIDSGPLYLPPNIFVLVFIYLVSFGDHWLVPSAFRYILISIKFKFWLLTCERNVIKVHNASNLHLVLLEWHFSLLIFRNQFSFLCSLYGS